MSTGTADDIPVDLEEDLRNSLIALYRLSDADIDRVQDEILAKQLPFGQAAVSCGAITQQEFDKAMAWSQQTARRTRWGVIETALNRRQTITIRHSVTVKPGPELTLLHDPYSPRSERIRGLRTELLMFESKRGRASVMAILSPGRGEGRSLLVAELAIAFAQLGKRTLLVDADLRRPRLHGLFEAENSWGLAQALAFSEPPNMLGVDGVPHLSLLTSGPTAPNPLELLSDGRFERRLMEWRNTFDFIILDTPPVSEYSDGLAVATMAGRVLLLSRAATTVFGETKEMLRRLGATQAQILGAVMNHF